MISNDLSDYLNINNILYKTDVKLSEFSFFKTGGKVDLVVLPDTNEKLKKLILYIQDSKHNYQIFGNTTNCIFRDSTNIEIIISLKKLKKITITDKSIIAESGVMLPKFVLECSKSGILGFEGLEGIPATLGGAVYMNAGSYGYDISDNLRKVTTINRQGQILKYSKDDLKFDFRTSIFKQGLDDIIVEVEFDIIEQSSLNIDSIINRIKKFKQHRHKFLEYKLPNVGSIFKTDDIYRDIADQNIIYKVILIFTRMVIHRVIRAKDNKLLNNITFNYFGINNKEIVSDKTMNTVVNNGKDTIVIEEYIDKIKEISKNTIELEIEII